MKAQHVLGPWTILTEGTEDDCIVRTIIGGHPNAPRNLSEVACVTTGSFTDEVEEANSRLICAAPDLLEALESIIGMAEDGHALHKRNGSHQEFLSEDIDALNKAKEAILKARGL